MNKIYFAVILLLKFLYIKRLDCLTFLHNDDKDGVELQYGKTGQTVIFKWKVQLSADDLYSKTIEIWVRLEKLIEDSSQPERSTFTEVTPFQKVSDLISSGNEFVRRIQIDIYEIGIYLSGLRLSDSGLYRMYVKTDDRFDYFSYNRKLKVVDPPKFVDCLQEIKAKTSELETQVYPQLNISCSCNASGYPPPKVYCMIAGSKQLARLSPHHTDIIFTLQSWRGIRPTIRCIADGGRHAGSIMISRNDYFVFHKPNAPTEIQQLPSNSRNSISFRWKHMSKDDVGGDIYLYVIRYRALLYGESKTIYLSPPKNYHHIEKKIYYVKDNYVYFEMNALDQSKNYSVVLQVWNVQGRHGEITKTVMITGFEAPIRETEPITSTHMAKSTTMIIATFALAGVLILLLITAILYRRKLHIRRAQCRCDNQEMVREQRDFFNISSSSVANPFVLPSYEEAIRTKPTESPPSFEDITQQQFRELQIRSTSSHVAVDEREHLTEEPLGIAPPPYPGVIMT